MANIARISRSNRIQSVDEHLEHVGDYCKVNAEKIGMGSCGRLAGITHDIGKYNQEFADYIRIKHENPELNIKGPDHSTVGAFYIHTLIKDKTNTMQLLTAQIISMAVMWHHGGLKDIRNFLGDSPYLDRLKKAKRSENNEMYCGLIDKFHNRFPREKVEEIFDSAVKEIAGIVKKTGENVSNKSERIFCLGLVCRYLYSCLIDADRYDAAMAMDDKMLEYPEGNDELWERLCIRYEEKFKCFSENAAEEINVLRTLLSDNCRKNANNPSGIYKLNCPTGAGKTLSSLRYALHHAKNYNKDRIFYIIPLISIVEQNSKVISDFLEEDEAILELHSAVEPDINIDVVGNDAEDYEMLTERMDSPIVITTMVRFLNTFFKGKTRNPRAMHNFANSIIIFDEIQTIPVKCIGMFNSLINFLVYTCNATVILSTATQIVLDRSHGTEMPLLGVKDNEISDCTGEIREKFVRVNYDLTMLYESGGELDDKNILHTSTLNDITGKIRDMIKIKKSVLCIFNTKRSTEAVFDAIKDLKTSGEIDKEVNIYFLTTGLCPEHRREILDKIREDLKNEKRIIVISTQLIEAGVDISFNVVIRAVAGLDSIIQAAGRCNRDGEDEERGKVCLCSPDFEKLGNLKSISKGKAATMKLLHVFRKKPEFFNYRLDSQAAIEFYFDSYLEDINTELKYPFKPDVSNSQVYMYDILSENGRNSTKDTILNQAFGTAGIYFNPLDDSGTPVVVPYGKGEELIIKAFSKETVKEKRELLRELQKYTINILTSNGNEINDYADFNEQLGIYILRGGYYDAIKGFNRESRWETLTF
ncbi:MAG: CRISPR-associated helicase Cas3' [Bacillota bacterium]|nr:CRISPR-associated helicase Cas3' [Bacillota bacterium]